MSSRRPPKYCRNRQKNRADRAYVRIDGKRIELGVYGTPESRAKYLTLIAEERPKPDRAGPAIVGANEPESPIGAPTSYGTAPAPKSVKKWALRPLSSIWGTPAAM